MIIIRIIAKIVKISLFFMKFITISIVIPVGKKKSKNY